MFSPTLVVDGQITGVWKQALKKAAVVIEVAPFRPLTPAENQALSAAAERYGAFLGLPAALLTPAP